MKCSTRDKRLVVFCFSIYMLSVLHLGMRLDTVGSLGGIIYNQADNRSTLVLTRSPDQTAGYRVLTLDPPWRKYYTTNTSRFQISPKVLDAMGFPLKRYVRLDTKTITEFVFVTAASDSFVRGVLNAISSVQKYYPDRHIIFYSLGLNGSNKKKILPLCNVEYRSFNFSKYPPHVQRLKSYAWKPLIIYEVLKESPGVFWIDSSVRLLSSDVNMTFPKLFQTDGILLFNFAGHNTFVVTHKSTFDYLPTNLTEMQRIYQYEANVMVIFGTASVFDGVIRWWVLCALVERCIAPVYSLSCRKTPPDVYAGCHRYDQTAINILLANKFNFDYTVYAKHYDNFEEIRRYSSGSGRARICS